MDSLTLVIAMVLSGFVAMFWWQHARYVRQCPSETQIADTTRAPLAAMTHKVPSIAIPALMTLTLLISSVGVYSITGRYSDWNSGKLDENIDYLVAADITKGRLAVGKSPENEIALLNLAQSYAAGGMYQDAVTTLDQLLALRGEDAELLGMKATAMYYRDQRDISLATNLVIARALALHREELQTRLLLATDAYLNGRYQDAIDHWHILLDNQSQGFNRASINNAILKAQSKLNSQN
ncbi:MAG: tetratricopeptide repeat protein [Shewanella sp.]